MPNATAPRVGYVIPQLSSDSIQHFAHSPRLVRELGESMSIVVIVERGEVPDRLPGADATLGISGRRRWSRPLQMLRVVFAARRLGVDTFFLRYSRTFALVLLATRPVLRHRIVYWRSGMADVVDPGSIDSTAACLRRWLDERLNRHILRLVDVVATGPEMMVEYTAERWNLELDRVRLLYNDIDVERFVPAEADKRLQIRASLGWAPDKFIILFVHHLSHRRGTRLLQPILNHLAELPGPDVEIIIVGTGPDQKLLQAQAAEQLGCNAAMSVVGPVPNRALPDYYAAADVFLMPSYEEGFPRVVLEAMASGVVVVTTDAGGTRDIVGPDHPYVTHVGDVRALSASIQELRTADRTLRSVIAQQARSRVVERFATPVVARMYAQVLR